jgi:uncharacterized protein YhbP (UPF0306 family)
MMEPATAENGWINTLDSKHPEAIAKARQLLETTHYCTVSTCSPDGLPWVSPVFFVYDEHWNLYWSSAIAAKHSQNLYHNQGRVAIALFNSTLAEGTAQGLYFSGFAAEVNSDQVEPIMQRLFQRAGKQHSRTRKDYLEDSPRRIYQFRPLEVWVTGDRLPVGNQLVDTKIRLHLADVIGVP